MQCVYDVETVCVCCAHVEIAGNCAFLKKQETVVVMGFDLTSGNV